MTTETKVEAVAWRARALDPIEGPSIWMPIDENNVATLEQNGHYEIEALVPSSALDALRGEVAELKQSLDRLSGMKFSDRMHAALVSRADAAERRVADLTSLLSDTAGNLRRMANDEFADCDQVRLEHVVNRIDAALTKESP